MKMKEANQKVFPETYYDFPVNTVSKQSLLKGSSLFGGEVELIRFYWSSNLLKNSSSFRWMEVFPLFCTIKT